MRLSRIGIALTGLCALAACGAANGPTPGASPTVSAVSSQAPAPSASATPNQTPTPSASATPATGILSIPELGVTMRIPSALTAVTYHLQDPSAYAQQWKDGSGAHDVVPVAVANLGSSQWNQSLPTTAECNIAYPAGTPEMVLTVWNVDPATLPGQDTSGLTPGATPHLGGRYFLVEGARGGGPNLCADGQPFMLTQADTLVNQQFTLFIEMVASVATT